MITKLKAEIRSNIFFMVPLVLSLHYNLYILWWLLSIVIIFSLLYHIANEKHWKIYDEIFAIGLMTYNLYLCFIGKFTEPYFLLAMIGVGIALYLYFKETKSNYRYNHSLWHLFSASITSLCIMVYVM